MRRLRMFILPAALALSLLATACGGSSGEAADGFAVVDHVDGHRLTP